MAKYSVLIPCTASVVVEVEADNAERAKDIALDTEFEVKVSGGAQLHEFEVHSEIVRGNVFYGVLNSIEADLIGGEDD